MHHLLPFTALAALLLTLGGCRPVYQEVTVEQMVSVHARGPDADGLALVAEVRVNNPNPYRIALSDPELTLYLGGTRVGAATLDSTVTLPADGTWVVRVPFHARLEGGPLVAMSLGMILGQRPVLRAEGTVQAAAGPVRRRIPFSLEAPLLP